ncbi:MAG: hypothetical protein CL675_09600 [Bdellovibrionaceae bacterium]|nr:hypothetical protein [Pseudobdellovibrionaceae bacterium]
MTLFPASLKQAYDLDRLKVAVSSKYGLVRNVYAIPGPTGQFPVVVKGTLQANRRFLGGRELPGAGAGFSHERATLSAIGEAVERFSASVPLMPDIANETLSSLRSQNLPVLDEQWLHAYEDFQYQLPNFPFRRFDPQAPYDWIYLENLTKRAPVLVPVEALSWVEGQFFEVNSSGYAAGQTKEKAAISGLLECIERDHFMYLWWTQTGAPAVQFPIQTDDPRGDKINQFVASMNGRLKVLQVQLDMDICGYIAYYRGEPKTGHNAFIVAGACRSNPVDAIHKVLTEFTHCHEFYEYFDNKTRFSDVSDYESEVTDFEIGSGIYLNFEKAKHCYFLWNGKFEPLKSFDYSSTSEEAELANIVKLISDVQCDAVIKDVTTRDMAKTGCSVVRAWVPQFIFPNGAHRSRNWGNKRLKELGMKLGHSDRPLTIKDFNQRPHPFP